MISRLDQHLSFEVRHHAAHLMTYVMTRVSRNLDCEFTATADDELEEAYESALFGLHLTLGRLPGDGPEHTYVLRGATGGLTGPDTAYLDLSPHVAHLLAGAGGRWDPA